MGITRKNALPGAVGNIGHHLRSWYIVRLRYQASLDWSHGKRFQERGARVGGGDAHAVRFSDQGCRADEPFLGRRRGLGLALKVVKFRVVHEAAEESAVP